MKNNPENKMEFKSKKRDFICIIEVFSRQEHIRLS
jgi:hypothetical protein